MINFLQNKADSINYSQLKKNKQYQNPVSFGLNPNSITEKNKEKIISLFMAGHNFKQIAQEIGCYRKTISDALERWGIYDKKYVERKPLNYNPNTNNKNILEKYKEIIINLYNSGLSLKKIAEIIKCDRTSISDALIKCGLHKKRDNVIRTSSEVNPYIKNNISIPSSIEKNIGNEISLIENNNIFLDNQTIIDLYLTQNLTPMQIVDKIGSDKEYVTNVLVSLGII